MTGDRCQFQSFSDLAAQLFLDYGRQTRFSTTASDLESVFDWQKCWYHGWQFGSDGQCVHIPQLAEGATIPRQAFIPAFKV